MVVKVDRRIYKTKKSIREALIIILKEKNRHQITVKELAEMADINRKTFYSHYDNIDDIFSSIEDEIIEKLLILLDEFDFFDLDLDINSLLKSLNQIINENFDLYDSLIKSDSQDMLSFKAKQSLKSKFNDIYALKYNINKDLLSFYTEYVISGILAMYFEWFRSDKTIKLEVVGQAASTIVFSGLGAILDTSN